MMIYTFNQQIIASNLIGYTNSTDSWILNERIIDDYELIFQASGSTAFILNNQIHQLTEGSMLIIPPNTPHRAYTLSCGHFYYCHIDIACLKETSENQVQMALDTYEVYLQEHLNTNAFFTLPKAPTSVFLPSHMTLDKSLSDLNALFSKALSHRDHFTLYSMSHIDALVSQILTTAGQWYLETLNYKDTLSTKGEIHPSLRNAILYIQQHLTSKLSVKDIASHIQITPQYLSQLFRHYYNCTTTDYIHNEKIKLSKKYIENTSLSLKEISYEIGLDNPYYFSRLYKKVEGITPSTYKKSISHKDNSN